MKNKSSYKF